MVRSRKRSDKVKIRDVFLLKKIDLIKSEHPYWGYRRVWAYMKYMNKESFAMARIYRIMKENNLLCTKNNRLRAKRTPPYPSKPKATKRNEVWGTDMTKIKTSLGWLHIHIVLDWYTKKIVGYYMSDKSKTEDWLQSLHMAINRQFPNGYRTKIRPLQLVSDNGCQPTSSAFMKACSQMGIKQLFTSFNNPKGNAETERVIRTLKEEISWPNEWDNGFSASSEVIRAIKKYNEDYPHSVINYFTPNAFDNLCKQKDLYSRSCA